jgi:hypothetical protein
MEQAKIEIRTEDRTMKYEDFMKLVKHERRIKGRKEGHLDGFRLTSLPKTWKKKSMKKEYKDVTIIDRTMMKIEKVKMV